MLNIASKKIGMTHSFREDGLLVPVTLLKVYENCVIKVETVSESKKVFIGFDKLSKDTKIKKPQVGLFKKLSLPSFRKIITSDIENESFEIGSSLPHDTLFAVGKKISITATSIGKGFAGAMKRHGFAGLEATHGVSVSHRSPGSTGQRQDPGKVFKGKKMPGHMGSTTITVKNLEILSFDKDQSILCVKGCVPGSKNSDVVIKVKSF